MYMEQRAHDAEIIAAAILEDSEKRYSVVSCRISYTRINY